MPMRQILAFVLCACAGLARADTAYVTDSLRLGIHHSEDTSGKPFANLVSGTPLEVLERNGSYAHVRTPDGDEGWVKATYLVTQKPAQLRVAELEAELAGLRSEIDHAHDARSSAETERDRLGKQAAVSAESSGALQETLDRLKRENEAYETRMDAYRGSLPLTWVAAALIVTLVGGFVTGLWWLDALIRRRHGGFRIY
jgi:SH3 domain protein